MLDDDARRALEEEAIALVSLSHSHPPKKTRRAPTASREGATVASTNKRSMDDRFVPASRSSGVFAATNSNHHHQQQQQQVHVMARPRVRISGSDQRTSLRETENDPRFLSMSVFVNADGEVNELIPQHPAGLEIRSLGLDAKHHHTHAATMVAAGFTRAPESASSSPTSTTASEPQISMQSLLVTLKKRKSGELQGESTQAAVVTGGPATTTTKLPRFRDVFVHDEMPVPPRTTLHVQASSTPLTRIAPLNAAPHSPSPPLEHESQPPAPPELKCKYRTGKCTNTRALKSCGDYHNLCNYHRLRANANQRKLDRKKKVQRVPSASDGAGSPSSAAVAPAVAAAAALASLPSSFVLPSSSSSSSEDPRQAGQYLPYFVPGGSSSSSSSTSSS